MTTQQRAGGSRTRLDRLTALRWVAALLVFGHHLNQNVLLEPKLGHLSDPGVSGVDFFFVLSGFVLAWSYRPSDRPGFFYRRRAARILPLYVLAWAAGLVLSAVVHGSTFAQQLPSLVLLQSWIPRFDIYFAGATVLWSLSCEAFFYLLFPALIGPLHRLRDNQLVVVAAFATVVAIGVPLVLPPADTDQGIRFWLIYPFPPTRLCEFVIGVTAAILVSRNALPRVPLGGALALSALAYVVSGWAPLWVQPVAATVVPYTLVIIAGAQRDLAPGRRAPRWLVRLGEWSFAFYLCQLTIIRLTVHWVHASGVGARVLLSAALFVIVLLVAAGLSEYVEKPLERRLRGDRSLPVSLS